MKRLSENGRCRFGKFVALVASAAVERFPILCLRHGVMDVAKLMPCGPSRPFPRNSCP